MPIGARWRFQCALCERRIPSRYKHSLLVYATEWLRQIPNLTIIGDALEKASVISLVIKGVPSEEVRARLNKHGIAVRSAHRSAQPISRRFGHETTVRPSLAFYNTFGEIDVLVAALKEIQAEMGIMRCRSAGSCRSFGRSTPGWYCSNPVALGSTKRHHEHAGIRCEKRTP